MNLEPMLGKQKWRSCSSQPTPRAARLLSPEPSILFVEPQEKNPSTHHLLHSHNLIPVQSQPTIAHGHTNIQYFAQDLVIYANLPALQHSTRSCDLIFGDDASCILSSHSVIFATYRFSLVGHQTLFQKLYPLIFSFSNYY